MRRILSGAILATAGACALFAPATQAATNAPLMFDCDAAAGRSASVGVGGGTAVAVTTRIAPRTLQRGQTRPTAGLTVSSADGRNVVGIQIVQASPTAQTFSLAVVGRNAGTPFRTPLAELPLAAPVDVIIQLDANGRGTIRIGAQQAPLSVADTGPKRVEAFCGSGQFRFDPLTVQSN